MSSSSSSSPSSISSLSSAAQASHYPNKKTNQHIPLGLSKLIDECHNIYPDQPNPLQITTIVKYWLGGLDPIDYISMYYNRGNIELNIPPHWHYISMGLSDLHGDGRVHRPAMSPAKTTDAEDATATSSPTIDEPRSGVGFELTFRLIIKNDEDNDDLKEDDDEEDNHRYWRRHKSPPTWPANLMQALARYVFQTGNRLCAGDHIPWHKTLDNLNKSEIKHMLIANDPQMQRIETAFGWIDFCQIVGVTDEELNQAARWNGNGVLDLLRQDMITGGDWLITDMDRCESVFGLFPETLEYLEDDLENDGSDLAGINAEFVFNELIRTSVKSEIDSETLNRQYIRDNQILTLKLENEEESLDTDRNEKEIVTTTKSHLQSSSSSSSSSSAVDNAIVVNASTDVHQPTLKIDDRKFLMTLSVNNSLNNSCPLDFQSNKTQVMPLEGLHLTLPPYATKFLILALKDRVRHGRHFTFKGKRLAITFVAESVDSAIVTRENPYAVTGYWIQVLITEELLPKMLESLQCLIDINADLDVGVNATEWPKEFNWPEHNLKIVIDNLPYDCNNMFGVMNC